MSRHERSAIHSNAITATSIAVALSAGAFGERRELVVGERYRSGEPDADTRVRVEAEARERRRGSPTSPVHRAAAPVVEHRLHEDEAAQLARLRRTAGDQRLPRKRRRIAGDDRFERRGERSQRRDEQVGRCSTLAARRRASATARPSRRARLDRPRAFRAAAARRSIRFVVCASSSADCEQQCQRARRTARRPVAIRHGTARDRLRAVARALLSPARRASGVAPSTTTAIRSVRRGNAASNVELALPPRRRRRRSAWRCRCRSRNAPRRTPARPRTAARTRR